MIVRWLVIENNDMFIYLLIQKKVQFKIYNLLYSAKNIIIFDFNSKK